MKLESIVICMVMAFIIMTLYIVQMVLFLKRIKDIKDERDQCLQDYEVLLKSYNDYATQVQMEHMQELTPVIGFVQPDESDYEEWEDE